MLYALMLPSGNDAAYALAEWGGKAIRKNCNFLRKLRPPTDSQFREDKNDSKAKKEEKSYKKLFVHHMNKFAKKMKLASTYYVNPHGLSN